MAQIDFDAWCDRNQIRHWREAFYHHLMSQDVTMESEEMLEREWKDFLAGALLELSSTLDGLKQKTWGGEG